MSPRTRIVAQTMAIALLSSFLGAAPARAEDGRGFVTALWPEAQQRGISRSIFDEALGNFEPRPEVARLTREQPEFAQSVGDYVTKRVDPRRIEEGRSKRAQWNETLEGIERQYGVSRDVILAVWGIETNFGSFLGGSNVPHSLATLTHKGYREAFFREELLTALEILDDGHIRANAMVGSWAGAMGQTQFMPTSFRTFAVDHDGDGKANIWTSVPDALASTANYLKQNGWRSGETWGYEIELPAGFDFPAAWATEKATISRWAGMGIARPSGASFPRRDDLARLYLPTGSDGPAFLLLANFDVIKRYNNADTYALSVGHLADRIRGGGAFAQAWPQGQMALTRDQRRELQTSLGAMGFDAGAPDGIVGPRTRFAILSYQQQAGMKADGHPSADLLRRIRGSK